MESVRELVKGGLPVDTCDFDNRTTLHMSTMMGNMKARQRERGSRGLGRAGGKA